MAPKLLLLAAFITSMILMSMNYGKRKKKVIFFGDSITEEGARRGGYISRIKELLRNEGVEDKYEFIGAGISGDKIYDLHQRVDEDVVAKFPDIVVIFIGVNDVWQKLSLGYTTDITDFEKHYKQILTKLFAANIKLIICTPAAIGEKNDNTNKPDNELQLFTASVKNIAATYQIPLVDLHKAFADYSGVNNPTNQGTGILTTDGVHLNDKGNQVVAEEIWKVLKEVR